MTIHRHKQSNGIACPYFYFGAMTVRNIFEVYESIRGIAFPPNIRAILKENKHKIDEIIALFPTESLEKIDSTNLDKDKLISEINADIENNNEGQNKLLREAILKLLNKEKDYFFNTFLEDLKKLDKEKLNNNSKQFLDKTLILAEKTINFMRDPAFNEIKDRIQFYTKELAKNNNELLRSKKKVLEAAQKFLEGELDRTQFYNVLMLAENKGWDKGWTFLSKSSKTEKLIMRTLHLADEELKGSISNPIIFDENKKPVATELHEKIIALKDEKLKTKLFNKYDLCSQKIAVLSATKTALENNKLPALAEVFTQNPRWEESVFFSSNTKYLVEEAYNIAQTSRNSSPRSLMTIGETDSVSTEVPDSKNSLYEKLNEKCIVSVRRTPSY